MAGQFGVPPVGNQNAANGKKWKAAIERALAARSKKDGKDALDSLANVLIDKALSGEQWALLELGNRFDGKPAQALEVAGTDGGPIKATVLVEFVNKAA